MKRLIAAALVATTALSGAALAQGNPHKPFKHKGKGPGHVNAQALHAPGQQKKLYGHTSARAFAPGQKVPAGYVVINDYTRYGLPAPGDGYQYVRYNDQVLKVVIQTAAVAATVGLVANLLN